MRKLESEMLNAIKSFTPWSEGNTCFHRMAGTSEGWELVLHGNVIALFDQGSKTPNLPTYISLAGYPTKTTQSRLNCLDGVNVRIKNGVPYLNGRKIDVDGYWSPNNMSY